ncbi:MULTISPECIES: NADPH-dependent L-lysine N(6)-monooxygenase MbtG [Mycobacterium]|uniref:L-lysine N6-monooxygenase MbtG n=1 Tax=Mycobacterium kiyosense TaxID=2871094 RepID=A0A9P3QC72_9MYCO|nr:MULTISPECIES: NADPH-dependent L-lysine N(6)-monooxygenase MbtG [Mycobacterium]BDE15041.1 L-lysine N6-monooxygenase MbtG [Mycobacterium sp. 20KCMC460]GLB82543.1 L-lysine N6-monooxygenase MbtG [Mycobacterium kiyosense]GLB87697.1 L-lysine N6-monooxygenase MbtG [Mycobacterium kiyosense]GLB97515.1 L-lysine N6-monooxygenase MbtG [Mycobacterium kiyosense]GLC04057.1 L-lysine N6-monooxygenase MbtG [Mycobacterium kiyosense]
MSRTLAVIGAGAKAVAVAAKAAVLREMGVETPDVVAIERTEVAANWLPGGGWTDGRQRLGTSPEKDVGFPYRSTLVAGRESEVDEQMMRFSWQSYLVASDQFVGWVDRGRPAPAHDTWARYLRWVAEVAGLKVVQGEARKIAVEQSRWAVHTSGSTVCADALMVTGPGQPERSMLSGDPRVLSIAQFWARAGQHERIVADSVAVIGGGETAASILNELFHHRVSSITAISPQATLFTRGEGFFENSLFSDPAGWRSLSHAERRNCIARTDRGVFSARVQESLLADERITHLRGRVARVFDQDNKIWITLRTDNCGEPQETLHRYDLVIDGSGADPLWFLPLLQPDAVGLLESEVGAPLSGERLEECIGPDLAIAGVNPKLFLPNLSGVNEGPGFPNLSCLGLLSDRVLGAEIQRAAATTSMGRSGEYQSV